MSKVEQYLQEHLLGEVISSTDARRYFATDGSILQLAPSLVVYPRSENDIRKTARFSWQLAERGRIIPISPRGLGTSQSGAALGNGILLVLPAYMNRILEIDTKANTVIVEPGINYGKLQQTLFTHERFLPQYPASQHYSTIGGAVANNAIGEKSFKYGDTRSAVKSLRIVLANGEVIETRRLSKRELNKKLGLATFEGEIYRSIDTLLEEQHELLSRLSNKVSRDNSGYDVQDIKRRDGSFDLTPLIVGSQGTLGIITEVTLLIERLNIQTTLFMAKFESLEKTQDAIMDLRKLAVQPSAVEMVDGNVLQQVYELNPNQFKDIIAPPFPSTVMLIELDGQDRAQKKLSKKVQKILNKYAVEQQHTSDLEQQQKFWKVRQSSSILISHNEGLLRSIPLFDAGIPPEHLSKYIEGIYKIMTANNLKPAVWGHAGDGVVYVQPRLNLGHVGDRQRVFRLLDEHNKLVYSLGGSISTGAGDGRLRTPYLENIFGPELYALLSKIKQIFDPYGTLHPGVKFGTTLDDIKAQIRPDFSISHLYDHLPRS